MPFAALSNNDNVSKRQELSYRSPDVLEKNKEAYVHLAHDCREVRFIAKHGTIRWIQQVLQQTGGGKESLGGED